MRNQGENGSCKVVLGGPPESPAAPADLKIRSLAAAGAEGPLEARIYCGSASGKRDVLVVFFHAGGFVDGDLDDADGFLRHLAGSAVRPLVLATRYTLATEKPFPAAVEDAHAVLQWAKKKKATLGWTGKSLVVAGIEAGANLAAVSVLMARDRGSPVIAGQILIMPMLDPGMTSCSMREVPHDAIVASVAVTCAASYRDYLPNPSDRAHPYASPLHSSRLKQLPPALILTAEDDPLRDEAEQYALRLNTSGVPTTLKRMAVTPLEMAQARSECACEAAALQEVATFLQTLERAPPPA